MTFFSSDILKQIISFNEQPSPDQTMQDLCSMKSSNESPLVPNSQHPTTTPQPINPPSLTAMPPAPTCKPIRMTPGLNNFSSSQIGFIPANPAFFPQSNCDGEGRYVKFDDVALQGWIPPPTRGAESRMMAPDEFMDDTPFMFSNGMVNAEMLSLWSEASATFR